MFKKIVIVAGGVSFILFGFVLLLSQVESELGWDLGFIAIFVFIFTSIAGLLFYGGVGRLGKAGLWIGLAGSSSIGILTLLDGFLSDLPWAFFLAFFICIPLGFVIYGLAALRSKPLRWGNGLPILAGMSFALFFLQDPSYPVWISQVMTFIQAFIWMALGYSLLLSQAGADEATSAPTLKSRSVIFGVLGLLIVAVGVQVYALQATASHDVCPTPVAVLPKLTGGPRPVIIDIDAAHEDMNATIYLLQHPNVDVKAVTVVGTGEAHCTAGVRNTRGLLALHGRPDIPVACGSETPMLGSQEFPSEWRADADNLYGLRLPENNSPATSLTAPELIASIINESREKVSVIAVGPLTNLGQALEADPALTDGIESIFVMGGAVEIGGNVGMSGVGIDNPVAEWNIFIDPRAANIVFESEAPVMLVPLNATRHAPVTTDFYRCIQENHHTPEAKFVYDILRANYEFVESGGFQFWDTLTAAILTDESLAEFETLDLITVEDPGLSLGQTRTDKTGHPVRVARSADGERFEALLLKVLNEAK